MSTEEKLNDSPLDTIGAFRTIHQNVLTVNINYDIMRLHVLKKSAEPIMWLHEEQIIFMAAAQLGEGKVVVVSSADIDRRILSCETPELAQGLKTWLTGNPDAPFEDLDEIQSISTVTRGAVVFTGWGVSETEDRMKEVIELVREGKIGLVLLVQDNESHDVLMKEIGMFVSSWEFKYFAGHDISVAAMRENPLFPLESLKEKLLSSYSAFVKYGLLFATALKTVPAVDRLSEIGITRSDALQLLDEYRDIAESKVPSEDSPITSNEDKAFIAAYNNLLLASELLVDSNIKAPGVSSFPGDICSPNLISERVKVTATVKDEYHPIGLYLPPGHTMSLTVHSGSAPDWSIQVGYWTDVNYHLDEWTRYPEIHSRHSLSTSKIFSAFGGNILIRNDQIESGFIELTLSGVVEAPYFNLRDATSVSNWMSRRKANAPWAEIVGDSVSFCLLSKTFAEWDTSMVTKFIDDIMDKIVKSDHHLLGKNWREKRREIIVFDRQISAGYGHSGYPIMGMLPWHSCNDFDLMSREGNWGVSHELGHNVQDPKFTWSKAVEVTVNIFSFWNYFYVFNIPFFKKGENRFDDGHIENIKTYLIDNDGQYEHWDDDFFSALTIFAQMANSFGWNLFKSVFRTYWDTNIAQPESDQEIIDEWMKRASKAANRNLSPMFDFWGLPLTDEARRSVEMLICFLPDDFVTQLVPDRVRMILQKYGNKCDRSAPKVEDNFGPVDLKPLRVNDVQVI